MLRFAAFLLVFLSHAVPGEDAFYQHAHIPSAAAHLIVAMAAGGAFGVDLFFALSAFLITTLLLREQDRQQRIDVPRFYLRRALRIWPLYFVFILFASVLGPHIAPGDPLSTKYLLAFVFFVGNWACVAWGFPQSIATPLWSVSIEEQFYLSWPIVLQLRRNYLLWVVLGFLLLSNFTRVFLVAHGAVHPQIWCNTLARLDPIAGGALVALWTQKAPVVSAPWLRCFLMAGGIGIFAAAAQYGDVAGTRALFTYPVVTVACIALLMATLGAPVTAASGRITRALAYLGRISYGSYVFHWGVIELFNVPTTHEPMARSARILMALVTTVALAALSYRYFESPFLRLKERFTWVQSRPV